MIGPSGGGNGGSGGGALLYKTVLLPLNAREHE